MRIALPKTNSKSSANRPKAQKESSLPTIIFFQGRKYWFSGEYQFENSKAMWWFSPEGFFLQEPGPHPHVQIHKMGPYTSYKWD